MRYELAHGRVQTWSLETHLVDHCNLRCASCCQLSPHMSERFLEPDQLARDLERAATVLAPRIFKFTGGEPTLHPELVECLRVARESKIAPRIQVTTNGTKLDDLPDAFFEAVDVVRLSWYPSAPLPEKTLARIADRCRAHGVELGTREYPAFQKLNPALLTHDDEAAARAYAGCWLKQRCHLVYRGRFYVCSRPPKLEPYLRRHGIENLLSTEDAVELEGARLLERMLAMLERDEPLASCRHCLGATGEWAAHRQLSRDEIERGLEG